MTNAEKALQYFIIAVPEDKEQAEAYFWARRALNAAIRAERAVGNTAHIDRQAWEPCECCCEEIGSTPYKAEKYPGICDFEVILDGGDEITVNAYNHYTPVTEEICFSFPVSFCPKCGRPLTEAAWVELEKRIGGTK